MIHSMTGYAAVARDIPRGTLQIELRGVNSRFLDLQFRINDDLRAIEPALRELFGAGMTRGKVECRLYFNAANVAAEADSIQPAALARLQLLQDQVLAAMPDARPLAVSDVLRWPGIFGDQDIDFAALTPLIMEMAREALGDFRASRVREGEKLGAMILERVARMRQIVAEVGPRIPEAHAIFADKLRNRLIEALGSADDERIRQEVAVFANRIDVAEEISRLTTHLDEVERVLKKGGATGKRLDFLMQELNREANTLGSKSVLTEVSQASMELKLCIEQMREQIQNLE